MGMLCMGWLIDVIKNATIWSKVLPFPSSSDGDEELSG
jgi:hypothetical protein